MPEIQKSKFVDKVLQDTLSKCTENRHQFVTPEHLLFALFGQDQFAAAVDYYIDILAVLPELEDHLKEMERVPWNMEYQPETSLQLTQLIENAYKMVEYSSATELDVPHLVRALLQLEDSWASYLLKRKLGDNEEDFLSELIGYYYESEMAASGDLSQRLHCRAASAHRP